jgi:hypothetical protein
MAQPTAQPTLTLISLLEARELVRQKYLSSARAGQLVVEWLGDENEPVRWQYTDIQNNSGVSTETVLSGFWRSAVINWEESSAARRVEPRTAAAHGTVLLPGGIIGSSQSRPTQPVSRLGSNFVVYGIRLAREDIERRLGGYDEPVSVAEPAPPSPASVADSAPPPTSVADHPAPPPSASVAEPLIPPKDWFARARREHPQRPGEGKMAYARRLHGLMQNAPVTRVWSLKTLRRRLDDPPSDDPSS